MDPSKTYGRPHPGGSDAVAYTGTAAASAAMPANAVAVRVVSTTDCFIEIGPDPTAVAESGLFLPAGVPEYFECSPNAKVSAIQATAGGTLYVTPFV